MRTEETISASETEPADDGAVRSDLYPTRSSSAFPRTKQSYCAATSWVWQRARLVCAAPKPADPQV